MRWYIRLWNDFAPRVNGLLINHGTDVSSFASTVHREKLITICMTYPYFAFDNVTSISQKKKKKVGNGEFWNLIAYIIAGPTITPLSHRKLELVLYPLAKIINVRIRKTAARGRRWPWRFTIAQSSYIADFRRAIFMLEKATEEDEEHAARERKEIHEFLVSVGLFARRVKQSLYVRNYVLGFRSCVYKFSPKE